MFFVSKHKWKLLDTDLSVEIGQPCLIQYTPMYASPEMVRAEDSGQTSIILETSADIWSYGILAFEMLTGQRFYGPSATRDTVKKFLCGRRELPSLECVDEQQARRWLSGLLEFDPKERWSAQRALVHAMFKTAEDTTQKAAGIEKLLESNDSKAKEVKDEIKQMKEPIIEEIKETTEEIKAPIRELQEALPDIQRDAKETIVEEIKEVGRAVASVQRTVVLTYREINRANLMVNIDLERSGGDRDGQRVVPNSDDYLKDEPVFQLRYDKLHRMRISLTHKHQSEAAKFKIHSVSAKPSDDIELDLDCTETKPASEGHEMVAWFHADMFPRSRLNKGCRQFGTVDQKYVQVAVKIVVEMASNDSAMMKERSFVIDGKVWCLPVSKRSFNWALWKLARFASAKWENAPQWMRDACRGAVILAEVSLNAF